MQELEAPENLTTNEKADNPDQEKKASTGKDELPQVNPTQSQNSDIEERAAFNGDANLQTSNRVDVGSKASAPNRTEEDTRQTG